MKYRVIIPKPVQKQLDGLPEHIRTRAIENLKALENEPRPHGCVKLRGRPHEYRVRIGTYRIRYEVDDGAPTVLLLHCGPRAGAYRG